MIWYVICTLHEMSIYMFSSLFDIFCMFDFAFEDRGEVREKNMPWEKSGRRLPIHGHFQPRWGGCFGWPKRRLVSMMPAMVKAGMDFRSWIAELFRDLSGILMVQVVSGSMHMLMYSLGGLPDDPRTMWVFLAQLCWNRAQAVLGYPHVSIPNLSL